MIECPVDGGSLLTCDEHLPADAMVAIDPGDVHVGLAIFEVTDHPRCTLAMETTPEGILDFLMFGCAGILAEVVYEQFILEPARAPMLVGTELETAQLIGAIKYAVHARVPLYGQTNKIKIPTRSVLKAKKVVAMAKKMKAGGHAADAELHGWHHLLKTKGYEL